MNGIFIQPTFINYQLFKVKFKLKTNQTMNNSHLTDKTEMCQPWERYIQKPFKEKEVIKLRSW